MPRHHCVTTKFGGPVWCYSRNALPRRGVRRGSFPLPLHDATRPDKAPEAPARRGGGSGGDGGGWDGGGGGDADGRRWPRRERVSSAKRPEQGEGSVNEGRPLRPSGPGILCNGGGLNICRQPDTVGLLQRQGTEQARSTTTHDGGCSHSWTGRHARPYQIIARQGNDLKASSENSKMTVKR